MYLDRCLFIVKGCEREQLLSSYSLIFIRSVSRKPSKKKVNSRFSEEKGNSEEAFGCKQLEVGPTSHWLYLHSRGEPLEYFWEGIQCSEVISQAILKIPISTIGCVEKLKAFQRKTFPGTVALGGELLGGERCHLRTVTIHKSQDRQNFAYQQ